MYMLNDEQYPNGEDKKSALVRLYPLMYLSVYRWRLLNFQVLTSNFLSFLRSSPNRECQRSVLCAS